MLWCGNAAAGRRITKRAKQKAGTLLQVPARVRW
jgi:hypothetical protein